MWFYLLENMHEKPLRFGRTHENEMKIYFLIFGVFFWNFVLFLEVLEEIRYF